MAVEVRWEPSGKLTLVHWLVQLLKPSILQRCPRRLGERAAIYGWFPPKVELRRVRTTDLENHYIYSAFRWYDIDAVLLSFSFSDFGADARNCNCKVGLAASLRCGAFIGWYWYCGRYTRVVVGVQYYFFHSGPSVRIGLKRFYGRSSERESGLLDVPLPCGGYSIRFRTVSS